MGNGATGGPRTEGKRYKAPQQTREQTREQKLAEARQQVAEAEAQVRARADEHRALQAAQRLDSAARMLMRQFSAEDRLEQAQQTLAKLEAHQARARAPKAAKPAAAPKAPKATPAQALEQAHAAFRAAANGTDAERLKAAEDLIKATRAASRASTKAAGSKAGDRSALPHLTPIHPDGVRRINALGALDPYALHYAYGAAQTRSVLTGLSLDELKASAAFVERRNPGTLPGGRLTKNGLVDYIMGHAAQE